MTFAEKVWAATRRVPRGKVATYKDIARAIGAPSAARAVGNALNKNPDTRRTPCHRVVRSDGSAGGYASGAKKKIARLRSEGVRIINEHVDLGCCQYIFSASKKTMSPPKRAR
ncbi:MAG: MGMT family protein [Patescibacteria group bacterium]